uniref:Uncharacterized protein n=1 Tax=Lepeophtheirus salmonis TaxID=72036 RepID=A0A0K2TMY5_LEPSM
MGLGSGELGGQTLDPAKSKKINYDNQINFFLVVWCEAEYFCHLQTLTVTS